MGERKGLKSTLKKAFFAVAALGVLAGTMEAIAYSPLNNEGSNILCDLDPSCRTLTEGEIELARTIFGDTLDYSRIKIFNRPNYMLEPFRKAASALDIGVNTDAPAMTPNSSIYVLDKKSYRDDYSKDPEAAALFIHEMTHVWQRQSGQSPFMSAIREYFNNGQDYNKAYIYQVSDGKSFAAIIWSSRPKW